MINKFKVKETLITVVLIVILVCIVVFVFPHIRIEFVFDSGQANKEVVTNKSEFVKVTAAHIPSTDFINMTCVYTDDECDIAVYICNDYTPEVPETDTEVIFQDGSLGTVVNTDFYGFYVKQEINTVTHGFSGTTVTDESGVYLGFVSSMDADGIIYCLAY